MSEGNHAYIDHVRRLEQRLGSGNEALRLAVGGRVRSCRQTGVLSLAFFGINHGASRCRCWLWERSTGAATSPDKASATSDRCRFPADRVGPSFDQARRWKFSVIEGVQIPCADNVADFVTFFSVLTHTTHEESFKYLQEASRCLKVGGRVVISFLEFRIPCHWETFIASVKAKAGGPLIQFLDRDAIAAWAGHAALPSILFRRRQRSYPDSGRDSVENGTCMKSLVILVSPSRCCEKSRIDGKAAMTCPRRDGVAIEKLNQRSASLRFD